MFSYLCDRRPHVVPHLVDMGFPLFEILALWDFFHTLSFDNADNYLFAYEYVRTTLGNISYP